MGRPQSYPWDTWLKPGNRFELVYKQHYFCSHTSMALMLRQRAHARGVTLSVGNNKAGNGLIVDVREKNRPMTNRKPIKDRITAKKVFPPVKRKVRV